MLSPEQDGKVIEWIQHEYLNNSPKSRDQIREYAKKYTNGKEVDRRWIYKFINNYPDIHIYIRRKDPTLLMQKQEGILAKWIKENLPTLPQAQEYMLNTFNIKPSETWIHSFCQKHSVQHHIMDEISDRCQHKIGHSRNFGSSDTLETLQQEMFGNSSATEFDAVYLESNSGGGMVHYLGSDYYSFEDDPNE